MKSLALKADMSLKKSDIKDVLLDSQLLFIDLKDEIPVWCVILVDAIRSSIHSKIDDYSFFATPVVPLRPT